MKTKLFIFASMLIILQSCASSGRNSFYHFTVLAEEVSTPISEIAQISYERKVMRTGLSNDYSSASNHFRNINFYRANRYSNFSVRLFENSSSEGLIETGNYFIYNDAGQPALYSKQQNGRISFEGYLNQGTHRNVFIGFNGRTITVEVYLGSPSSTIKVAGQTVVFYNKISYKQATRRYWR